jgi:hypothetical protein
MTQGKLGLRCSDARPRRRRITPYILGLLAALLVVGLSTDSDAQNARGNPHKRAGFCTRTAKAALTACGNEVRSDFWIAIANCINVLDDQERKACEVDASEAKEHGSEACKDQLQARLDVCAVVGQDRYDPDFDPAQFVDPAEIGVSVTPNPYVPLVTGTTWIYREGEQTTTVTVTGKTKLIEGISCRVVHDVVEEDGVAIDVTDDWVAQDLAGNVWFCGEIAQVFESFEGDVPREPELVSIEGSSKAGRGSDKPGIFVLASPQVGDGYIEEFSLGNAEDAAKVISITGNEAVPAAMCNNNCLVTRNISGIEPGVSETKYYLPGVGLILEVDQDGSRTELVEVRH